MKSAPRRYAPRMRSHAAALAANRDEEALPGRSTRPGRPSAAPSASCRWWHRPASEGQHQPCGACFDAWGRPADRGGQVVMADIDTTRRPDHLPAHPAGRHPRPPGEIPRRTTRPPRRGIRPGPPLGRTRGHRPRNNHHQRRTSTPHHHPEHPNGQETPDAIATDHTPARRCTTTRPTHRTSTPYRTS